MLFFVPELHEVATPLLTIPLPVDPAPLMRTKHKLVVRQAVLRQSDFENKQQERLFHIKLLL